MVDVALEVGGGVLLELVLRQVLVLVSRGARDGRDDVVAGHRALAGRREVLREGRVGVVRETGEELGASLGGGAGTVKITKVEYILGAFWWEGFLA